MYNNIKTMTVLINGKEDCRKIDHIERDLIGIEPDREIPVLYPGEEIFWQYSSNVPIIVQKGSA